MVKHTPTPNNATNEDKKTSCDEDDDSSDTLVIKQSNDKRRELANEETSTFSYRQHQIAIKTCLNAAKS